MARHEYRFFLADFNDEASVGRAPEAERAVVRRPRQRDRLLQLPPPRVAAAGFRVVHDRIVVQIGFAAGVVEAVREDAKLPVRGLHDGDVLLPVAGRRRDDLEGELHGARVEHEPAAGEAVHPVEAAVRVVAAVPDGADGAAERGAVPAPDEAVRRLERAPPAVARREGEGDHFPRGTGRPEHGERWIRVDVVHAAGLGVGGGEEGLARAAAAEDGEHAVDGVGEVVRDGREQDVAAGQRVADGELGEDGAPGGRRHAVEEEAAVAVVPDHPLGGGGGGGGPSFPVFSSSPTALLILY